ncbi:MAG: hypothetical protein A2Z21_08660 [Candidatus Fraserbacteria bacterium RBG_16_55_9]|uniref:Uncharacterized protein n=1 Tax=Fraserbacteria sp. (strain RBG_16_55_9) TaxID=1817864 RepID=A0A1F5UQJ2_FRAXR|nr:MAG: hypothetical protein A2Z21_08660 [Candidatus Fraserbacteria bacterium RBG_16_55_9]
MIKKSLVVALAILFTSVLTANVWAEDYTDLEKKIEELSKSMEKLEGMVKDLSFQLQQTQALSSIVKELSFELKQTESTVRDVSGITKKVNEEIQPHLLTLEGTLQGVAASFNEKFSVFQGRVFDLETTVQGLDSRLKSVEGKIRDLLNLDMQIRQIDKRVTALEQSAGKMPSDAGKQPDVTGQIQALKDRLQSLEAASADLVAQVGKDHSRITSLELTKADSDEVEALRAQVTQLEQQLQAEVEEVKSQASMGTALGGLALVAGLIALASVFKII